MVTGLFASTNVIPEIQRILCVPGETLTRDKGKSMQRNQSGDGWKREDAIIESAFKCQGNVLEAHCAGLSVKTHTSANLNHSVWWCFFYACGFSFI